jgi:hypothetical protein
LYVKKKKQQKKKQHDTGSREVHFCRQAGAWPLGLFINFAIPITKKKMANVPTKPERAVATFSFFIPGNE